MIGCVRSTKQLCFGSCLLLCIPSYSLYLSETLSFVCYKRVISVPLVMYDGVHVLCKKNVFVTNVLPFQQRSNETNLNPNCLNWTHSQLLSAQGMFSHVFFFLLKNFFVIKNVRCFDWSTEILLMSSFC